MAIIRDMRPKDGSHKYHRDGFIEFCEEYLHQPGMEIVEVGSWKGESATIMATHTFLDTEIICVDPWAGKLPEGYGHTMQDVYLEFLRNTIECKNIRSIRLPSVEAASLFRDESVDAVYIDASHIYGNVLNDITAWLPIVRRGGIIAGHDYDLDGVKRAVNEVFGPPEATFADNTWVVRK